MTSQGNSRDLAKVKVKGKGESRPRSRQAEVKYANEAAILESLASDWLIGRELGHVTPFLDRKPPNPYRKSLTGSPQGILSQTGSPR